MHSVSWPGGQPAEGPSQMGFLVKRYEAVSGGCGNKGHLLRAEAAWCQGWAEGCSLVPALAHTLPFGVWSEV